MRRWFDRLLTRWTGCAICAGRVNPQRSKLRGNRAACCSEDCYQMLYEMLERGEL